MAALREKVLGLVRAWPGLTDREITDHLLGSGAAQQRVNHIARSLAAQRLVARRPRHDGRLGNFPAETSRQPSLPNQGSPSTDAMETEALSEDDARVLTSTLFNRVVAGSSRSRAEAPWIRCE